MEIYHNNILICSLMNPDKKTVLDEIEHVMSAISNEDQVIKEVLIDGKDVTGNMERHLVSEFNAIRKIHFISVDRNKMFLSLVQDMKAYLSNVMQACESISDLFYGEMNERAWSLLEQLLESLQFVNDFVQAIKIHLQQLGNQSSQLDQLTEIENALITQLSQFEQALQAQDLVLAGDILKYEIGGLTQKLQDILEKSEPK